MVCKETWWVVTVNGIPVVFFKIKELAELFWRKCLETKEPGFSMFKKQVWYNK